MFPRAVQAVHFRYFLCMSAVHQEEAFWQYTEVNTQLSSKVTGAFYDGPFLVGFRFDV